MKALASLRFVLLISISVSVITISLYLFGALERFEYFAFDGFQKIFRLNKKPPSEIKVILIDEASLKAIEPIAGRWPWPRALWADLLEFLQSGGARAVLFDVLFTERQGDRNDIALVEASKRAGNIYHSMMILKESDELSPELGRAMPEDFKESFSLKNVSGNPALKDNNNFYLPFRELYEVSKGIGVVEFSPDSDGSFRRTEPIRKYQDSYFPVLGLAPFIERDTKVVAEKGSIRVGKRNIPIDKNGRCIINMYGAVEPYSIGGIFASLQKLRAGDIEDLLVSPEEFRDSIVFIGGSAVGVEDLKPTPLAARTPGVFLHLSLAGNYILDDFMRPPDRRLTIFSVLIAAVVSSFLVLKLKRFFLRVISPLFMLSIWGGVSYLMFRENMAVEVVPFLLSLSLSVFFSFGYLTIVETKEKRKISKLFSQYVSKDVLDEIMKHGTDYVPTGGSKIEISVLFSDIRGFTTISENTPPEKIVDMLNCFFSCMADIILSHKGTLDKYIGDAIMAFWGAPIPDKDHAIHAVETALEMLASLDRVNKELREKGYDFEIKIGIGINSGIATVGNIGSMKKLNYTAVGDTVNLASRLEGLTKEYSTRLIISEYTYERVKDRVHCVPLGSVRVKGREQPVWIYTPEGAFETERKEV